MRFTIIKDDGSVYYDGKMQSWVDLSDVSEGIHAVQWDGSNGHIEYNDVTKPNLEISSTSELESAMGVSIDTLKARADARASEPPPGIEG